MIKKSTIFVGDFETTVYENQEKTEVWASALVELNSNDVVVLNSLPATWNFLKKIKGNIVIYYHNLAFDGMFWLYFLLYTLKFNQGILKISDKKVMKKQKDLQNKEFIYNISDKGKFYTISIKYGNRIIELRDSFKLLPYSVKKIGESFGTLHKKSDIEYKGERKAGGNITEEERNYIANDVLVVKEALEIMFMQGHTDLTIGACCMKEYKKIVGKYDFNTFFPNLYEKDCPIDGFDSIGQYILKSYRGGWCYLAEGKENKEYSNGITLDVNSLYPSVMHSSSGNLYPVGLPSFWEGNYIPDEAFDENKYFFVRIKCRFILKKGYLPFIQIKNNLFYKSNEMLKTSDILDRKTGKYHEYYEDFNGEKYIAKVEMTLTKTDYLLFLEHYYVYDLEILDGCWFYSEIGLFDDYINKYREIKMKSKGAKREEAKLFLNNLYGKFSTYINSSFKYIIDDNGIIKFNIQAEYDKTPGYIPVGACVTSFARNFTIRAAQQNYYGPEKQGFIYADTDSLHMDFSENKVRGVKLDDKEFSCWKIEKKWEKGVFVRQKTYIEIENGSYFICCAGMPARSQMLLNCQMNDRIPNIYLSKNELKFLCKPALTISDFKKGLVVPGSLKQKNIKGGVVLNDDTYTMR